MANQEHLNLFKQLIVSWTTIGTPAYNTQGITAWNRWRNEDRDIRPDLTGADLSFAELDGADLSGAFLMRANLCSASLVRANLAAAELIEANLEKANLVESKLLWANLQRANLREAGLGEAYLREANLSETDLSKTDLTIADLRGANLSRADLTEASVGNTVLADVDLSTVIGLETVKHVGPSHISVSTLLRSKGNIPEVFLRGVGISDTFIDYLPSLLTIPVQYDSLFLSYSHHDQSFTERIYNDLQNQGVRCWFAPHDLRPGTPIMRGLEEAIHLHKKLLLILSHHAVMSNWVQQEVEVALYKEVTTGQELLLPIRLDNTVLESDTLWAKRLRQRHIGDFTGWQNDTAYQQAFATLLRHLKVAKPPTV